MTAETYRDLVNCTHDANALGQLVPEAAADAARLAAAVTPDAEPWQAIAAATDFLRAHFSSGHDCRHPHALAHWHRLAWLDVLRAASSAAGCGADDAPRWAHMTAAELADELEYLADHQG